MKADERERLYEELLDHHYGCAEDPEGLAGRIAAEPDVRALWEEVRATARMLDQAARSPAPELALAEPRERARPRWGRATLRLAAAAAFVGLVAVPGARWALAELGLERAASTGLRLVASAPAGVPDGAPASVRVETWSLEGEPLAAELAWVAYDSEGAELARGDERADGALDLALPAQLEGLRRLDLVATRDATVRRASLAFAPDVEAPVAHLSTDKPAYRPGETVWLRATLLQRLSLAPWQGTCRLRIVDPKGAPVAQATPTAEDGVAAWSWTIPADAAGGEYALELRDARDGFAFERLPLLVRAYQPPQLAKRVELDRETYAPGEGGAAELFVERATGGPAAGALVEAILVLDGAEVWNDSATLDAEGRAAFSFRVPRDVERGEARFVARVRDGGVVETAIEPFVVPTGEVEVAFYPEGGELVEGLASRVYAEVSDPLGRPASARGRVVDGAGREVARFDTLHQGRARFELRPRVGERYRLELDEPAKRSLELPAARAQGVALRALREGYGPGEPIELEVGTSAPGPWIAGLFCRGVLVAQDAFQGSGTQRVSLAAPADVAGVLRVSVFDASMKPVAERLVHRASGRAITVEVEPRERRLLPGGHQVLDLRARDETGRPVAAVLGLSVSDRAVRDMIGEQRVGLADHTWLVSDAGELEDAGEFLAGGAEAERNVDLLLGTLGWRRFGWVDPEALIAAHGDQARSLLVREGSPRHPQVVDESGDARQLVATARVEAREARQAFARLGLAFVALGALGALALGLRKLSRMSPPLALATAGAFALLAFLGVRVLNSPLGADMAPALGFAARQEVFLEAGIDALAVEEPAVFAMGMDAAAPPEAMRRLQALPPGHELMELRELGYPGAGAEGAVALGVERIVQEEEALGEPPPNEGFFADDLVAGEAFELAARRRARPVFRDFRPAAVYTRVYAHRNERAPDAPRTDFAETVYWNALLRTSATGEARVEFDLSDRVTSWRVDVDAHGAGRVGQARASFEAVPPFRMEATLPVELTQGDRIELPVSLAAEGGAERAELRASLSGPFAALAGDLIEVALEDGRGRVLLPIEVTGTEGEGTLALQGRASGWSDGVEQTIRVVPNGFPHRVSKSGVVRESAEVLVPFPEELVASSLELRLTLYPSPLADLLEGLDGILREPHGCFEQASSANYPNVLALAYLEAAGGDSPAVAARARELLARGYDKIVGYECDERGYEWFGGDPGHEALTAYGLLEFHDMAAVHDVDAAMMARTRDWLLGRRDGEGGYLRNERALDSFGRAPAQVTDAYVTYALAVSGTEPERIADELDRLEARALESSDPYEVALAAAGLQAAGRPEPADAARERLKSMQQGDGSLVGTTKSITCSGPRDLAVETTSLAILAWLDDPDDEAYVRRAVEFVLSSRSGSGTFGATQATVQALRALTAYAQASRRVANAGELRVLVNDYEVETRPFAAGHKGSIVLADLERHLAPGDNRLRLELSGGNEFPWALELSYASQKPADDPDARVAIRTSLGETSVEEGRSVPLRVELENLTDEGLPMTLAVVGIPAGLEVPTEVLEDLLEGQRFDFWELRGRELVLYWRDLAPRETIDLSIDLLARLPGTTRGPASRAYLYYTPDAKRWAEGLELRVRPLER